MELLSRQPYSTSRRFIATGMLWAVVGVLGGVIAALELIAPDVIGRFPILTFGRLRPVHVNVVAFGFIYSLLLAGTAYVVPRLCRVEGLWSERLGNLTVYLWNLVFIAAALTIPFGKTQAREYAELIYPIDLLVVLTLGLHTLNIYMTIYRRRENLLYVSLWYIAGGMAWTLSVYFLGNIMFLPPSETGALTSLGFLPPGKAGALTGISDTIWLWFYGHNVVGLILTPLGVAMAYWVLPRAVNRPVWSHTMSLMGFWILLVIYTHTGTHHLLQAPVPRWLKVIAIVDSIALVIPVATVLLNVWLPMRGCWHKIHHNVGAKFVFAGTIWYMITCFQGPMHSLPSVQKITHFTHWVVAHAHIAILGFAGFIAIGTTYAILPAVSGKRLYSRRLADQQYWIMLAGLILMFLSLSVAGLIQGAGWWNGEAFYRILTQMPLYLILRGVSGVAILAGVLLMAYNVACTLWLPAAESVARETPQAAATGGRRVGTSLEMTPRVTVIGSLLAFFVVVCIVVLFPTYENRQEQSDTYRPRTALENEGRGIYIANGCQYCHSQYVRSQDRDYGHNRIAQAGDYVGDTPPLLGSERQGPDLSQEGGLRSNDWHFAHFFNPRYTRSASIMPPFYWLGKDGITTLTAYVQSLGGTDADKRMQRQRYWKAQAVAAYRRGPIRNMGWLHANLPGQWLEMPGPYPATKTSVKRGEKIYEEYCIGCHGPVGDGMGPAARWTTGTLRLDPPPFNFTYLAKWDGPVGGMIYHQVMNGITGTAMPPFKTELESEKIWDVGNFVAVYFAGGSVIEEGPSGIPASYEAPRPGESAFGGERNK